MPVLPRLAKTQLEGFASVAARLALRATMKEPFAPNHCRTWRGFDKSWIGTGKSRSSSDRPRLGCLSWRSGSGISTGRMRCLQYSQCSSAYFGLDHTRPCTFVS